MKTIRLLIMTIALLPFVQIVNAQEDYDFYLQKAQQRLAEGDCTRAEASYNTYKDLAHKTDKEIELQIEECKNGGSSSLGGDLPFTVHGVLFTMKPIEGGTFWMGAQKSDPNGQNYDSEADNDESPVHGVTLSSYYMGETEVTQALWKAVMGNNPSNFKGDNLPVENVSWDDCQEFIRKLNQETGKNFRLPTEAEWEYAARGGKKSNGYKYSGSNNIGSVAWYDDNSSNQTHAVKGKRPNELGLYDMSGNVWEWCSDMFDDYGSGSQTHPNPQSTSKSFSSRVLRGGSWDFGARRCRVSNRNCDSPGLRTLDLGFRLCLPQ